MKQSLELNCLIPPEMDWQLASPSASPQSPVTRPPRQRTLHKFSIPFLLGPPVDYSCPLSPPASPHWKSHHTLRHSVGQFQSCDLGSHTPECSVLNDTSPAAILMTFQQQVRNFCAGLHADSGSVKPSLTQSPSPSVPDHAPRVAEKRVGRKRKLTYEPVDKYCDFCQSNTTSQWRRGMQGCD